ncbi:hypothetical protein N656DRAFT_602206 [Canariomyces notabilis]|uniref:Uncharacterized protein n=1 Tax=Canariomyces notabilis TaxID=2074819 RepID=A0AAN6TG87_9PEZI|nr:hypothetical protein N656DRAFT_602206 [Canariomyces arenarius]
MCHLATFRHGCGHWTLFQLHCDRGQDQLCDKGQTEVIARYRTGLQCLDCFDRECTIPHTKPRLQREILDENRLARTDDSLATLARKAASGSLSPETCASLTCNIAAQDRALEEQARVARHRRRGEIVLARRWAGQHARAFLAARSRHHHHRRGLGVALVPGCVGGRAGSQNQSQGSGSGRSREQPGLSRGLSLSLRLGGGQPQGRDQGRGDGRNGNWNGAGANAEIMQPRAQPTG